MSTLNIPVKINITTENNVGSDVVKIGDMTLDGDTNLVLNVFVKVESCDTKP